MDSSPKPRSLDRMDCKSYCRHALDHKVAIAIGSTLSLGTSIFVYYYFASQLDEKGLLGAAPWIEGYLRFSAIAFFLIALVTYALTFLNFKATRLVLTITTSLVIADLAFALICYFGLRSLLINSYKPVFSSTKFVLVAEAYEKSEQCCGWNNDPALVHTEGCQWEQSCDKVMRAQMGGKNMIVFAVGISLSLALMIYVLVTHILVYAKYSDYKQLSTSTSCQ